MNNPEIITVNHEVWKQDKLALNPDNFAQEILAKTKDELIGEINGKTKSLIARINWELSGKDADDQASREVAQKLQNVFADFMTNEKTSSQDLVATLDIFDKNKEITALLKPKSWLDQGTEWLMGKAKGTTPWKNLNPKNREEQIRIAMGG